MFFIPWGGQCLRVLKRWDVTAVSWRKGFQWSSLEFADEFCLCAWLCFLLFQKHTPFRQTLGLRWDADRGGLDGRTFYLTDSWIWRKKIQNLTLSRDNNSFYTQPPTPKKLPDFFGHFLDGDFSLNSALPEFQRRLAISHQISEVFWQEFRRFF